MEFLKQFWPYILVAVLVIAFLILALLTKNKKIKAAAYELVLKAEEVIKGPKQGQAKLAWVIDQIQIYIPKFLLWYFTDERIKAIIEWAVTKMKNQLDNDPNTK